MGLKDCLMGWVLSVATCLGAFDAAAAVAPQGISHEGRLFDSQGKPAAGVLKMTFTLYDAQVGGAARWSETVDVRFVDGNYAVRLGEVRPIDAGLLDGSLRWLALAFGEGPQIPGRLAIACDPVVFAGPQEVVEPGTYDQEEAEVRRPPGVVLAAEYAQAAIGPLPAARGVGFLGATVRMTVAPERAVLVSAKAVVGTKVRTGAGSLHLTVCARRAGGERLFDSSDGRLSGLRVGANGRQQFAVRSRFVDLAPGEYEFGLCGWVADTTSEWNDNDTAGVSVLLMTR